MRALQVIVGIPSGSIAAVLLVEPPDSVQVSLANGVEFYWAEAMQLMGLAGKERDWRFYQGRQEGPTRVHVTESVLLYGEIQRGGSGWQAGRPRYTSVRYTDAQPEVLQSLAESYALSFGGRIREIPPVFMAP